MPLTRETYRLNALVLTLLLCVSSLHGQELRSTWLSRNSFATKATLAAQMDSLAANNFNVVYVNCWSRGYPLWKSTVFFSHTGTYIDPTYSGRDILAEAVAEAHRVGLHIEAWFEYGFVGGWTGNIPAGQKGPIFNAHPDWVERKADSTEMDSNNFYWMIHTHPDAQNFLIAMAAEVARNYDVDGIELDRIRYSSLDYGYDTYTSNLYKSENSGASPPAGSSSQWIRWRADKLNSFIARAYDTIKSINSNLTVSNAPSQYSSSSYAAYNSFCQDWAWWVNNNKVDYVSIQMYVTSSTTFASYVDYAKTKVTTTTKIFPSFAIVAGGVTITDATITNMFSAISSKSLLGTSIWYYDDLVAKFPYIKANHYTTAKYPPFSSAAWRSYKAITAHTNGTDAVKTGTWVSSSLTGYSGNSVYCTNSASASIDYYLNVPLAGWYEVYAYTVASSNRSTNAAYTVYHSSGNATVNVNQTLAGNDRWYKLGDYYLNAGRNRIIRLSNSGLASGQLLSGDAVMITLNRNKTSGVPLPVELQGFTAKATGNAVTLSWQTATEINNFGFTIQRKRAEEDWLNRGFVKGAGNSNSIKYYNFTDTVALQGVYFYRLQQTDNDGSESTSPVAEITAGSQYYTGLCRSYPNPFTGTVTLSGTVTGHEDSELTIWNLTGEKIRTFKITGNTTGVFSIMWNGTSAGNNPVPSGVYFITLTSAGKVYTEKLLKLF